MILGGLIKNKSDVLDTKTPLLGDIPVLGELFKHTKEVKDKVNLVVIVTPYIIPKSKDLTFIREQLSSLKQLEQNYTHKLEMALENHKEKQIKNKMKTQKSETTTPQKYNTTQEQHNAILNGFSH